MRKFLAAAVSAAILASCSNTKETEQYAPKAYPLPVSAAVPKIERLADDKDSDYCLRESGIIIHLSVPAQCIDELIVNTRNKSRTVMLGTEQKGVADIRKLLNGDQEEAWAFLPQYNLWIEIGERETRHEGGYSIEMNQKDLDALGDFADRIIYTTFIQITVLLQIQKTT